MSNEETEALKITIGEPTFLSPVRYQNSPVVATERNVRAGAAVDARHDAIAQHSQRRPDVLQVSALLRSAADVQE